MRVKLSTDEGIYLDQILDVKEGDKFAVGPDGSLITVD